jgi:hypothetical protein
MCGMTRASQKPEEFMDNLRMMVPAMNPYERADLLMDIKATAPPETFQNVCNLAQRALNPNDWSALKTRIGTK